MTCYRYIELNPVVAGMVQTPDEYCWSSYLSNAWGKSDNLVAAHDVYLGLAETIKEVYRCYRDLFRFAIPEFDIHQIRQGFASELPGG